MSSRTRTWHHGFVARWWAEFHEGGEDLEYFRRVVERSGEPALDAACGTGRLLLPLRHAGLDVDGSDASADMLAWCRKKAESEGLSVNVYEQPMRALDLPRKYRTVIICGAFGLGGTRADDLEGLRRIRALLEPGGTLVMDYDLPNFDRPAWDAWIKRPTLPSPWPTRGDRRVASDGTELELRTRRVAFDSLAQTATLEIRVCQYIAGNEVACETYAIDMCIYFKNEIELMLATAGFHSVAVTAALEDRAPQPWKDERVIFTAHA